VLQQAAAQQASAIDREVHDLAGLQAVVEAVAQAPDQVVAIDDAPDQREYLVAIGAGQQVGATDQLTVELLVQCRIEQERVGAFLVTPQRLPGDAPVAGLLELPQQIGNVSVCSRASWLRLR
jgi:hypothetical protein